MDAISETVTDPTSATPPTSTQSSVLQSNQSEEISMDFEELARISLDRQSQDSDQGDSSKNALDDKSSKTGETKSSRCDKLIPKESIRRFKNNKYLIKAREISGTIVNNSKFQLCIVYLILINAIMMGLATFDFVEDSARATSAFETTDKVFLVIFTIELGLQFLHHGVYLFSDGWLVFDFVIVLMSWSLESLQIVRTFRIFRALRLVTRVKTLKNLVSALFSVGPRMTAIFALLFLIFYIYGVMCTVLFKDLYIDGHTKKDYFSRLDVTCWTLLVIMTLDWAEIARQVMDVYPHSWIIFVSFVMITSFIAYNLIIAVVCDSVAIIESKQKEVDKHNNFSFYIESGEGKELLTDEELNQLKLYNLRQRVDSIMEQQQAVLQRLDAALSRMGAAPVPSNPQKSEPSTNRVEFLETELSAPLVVPSTRNPLKSSLKSSIKSSSAL